MSAKERLALVFRGDAFGVFLCPLAALGAGLALGFGLPLVVAVEIALILSFAAAIASVLWP